MNHLIPALLRQPLCSQSTRHRPSLLRLPLLPLLTALLLAGCDYGQPSTPIEIGVLHSLSGHMATNEVPMVDAVQLAIEDINAAGGVLGRPLKAIVIDGKSDPKVFAAGAHQLINSASVPVIFGCWTSACRKAVKPVVENFDHLLFYPLQYEGQEQSPNIVYTGAAPNQQIIPGVHWALQHLGSRLYLLGSDYIFPRAANRLISDLAGLQQADILAERYPPLDLDQPGSEQLTAIITEIATLQPDVIINTVNGGANQALFPALRDNPRTADIPVMSFSISETELAAIGPSASIAHYVVWNYFQSIDSRQNNTFVRRFQQRFGEHRVIGDAMQSTWVGVHLWAQAANDAGDIAPASVLQTIGRQSMNAPEGIVSIDSINRHLWKTVRIGQALPNGQFQIIWSSDQPIRPEPYPLYRSIDHWRDHNAPLQLTGDAP